MKKVLSRFGMYALVGVCAFCLDISLLYIFIDLLFWNYIISTALAFIIAVTAHHYFTHNYVFYETKESHAKTYSRFILIALSGLILTTTAITLCVELFHFNIFTSRFFIAGFIGIWSFSMNFFINFKMSHR